MDQGVSFVEIAKITSEIGWDILDILSKVENITVNDLCKKLNLYYPKLANELNRLEGGLLIKYSKSNSDKRNVYIQINDYGFEVLKLKNNL
ncbi:MAG: hypothetical protein AB7V16_11395 [Vulcanibacillus sp.]